MIDLNDLRLEIETLQNSNLLDYGTAVKPVNQSPDTLAASWVAGSGWTYTDVNGVDADGWQRWSSTAVSTTAGQLIGTSIAMTATAGQVWSGQVKMGYISDPKAFRVSLGAYNGTTRLATVATATVTYTGYAPTAGILLYDLKPSAACPTNTTNVKWEFYTENAWSWSGTMNVDFYNPIAVRSGIGIAGWGVTGGSLMTIYARNVDSQTGAYTDWSLNGNVYRLVSNGGSAGYAYSSWYTLDAKKSTYSAAADLRGGGYYGKVSIEFNSGGTFDGNYVNLSSTTQRSSVTATVPAGATQARVRVNLNETSTGNNPAAMRWADFDGVVLSDGSVSTWAETNDNFNALPNPNAERGAWGFTEDDPTAGTFITNYKEYPEELNNFGANNGYVGVDGRTWQDASRFVLVGNTAAVVVHSNNIAVTAGQWVRASIFDARSDGGNVRVGVRFYDSANTLLATNWSATGTGTATFKITTGGVQAPANTVNARVIVEGPAASYNPTNYDPQYLGAQWRNTHFAIGSSQSAVESLPYSENLRYRNILSPASSINIKKGELEVGICSAKVHDSTVDPAVVAEIIPGKRMRVRAVVDGVWSDVFNGTLLNANTVYNKNQRPDITLTAIDAVNLLANTPYASGVADMDNLGYALQSINAPYNINGKTSFDGAAPVATFTDPDKTLLDQVAITRDTEKGYAWVDRFGVLNAWDGTRKPGNSRIWFSDAAAPAIVKTTNDAINPRGVSDTTFGWTATPTNATAAAISGGGWRGTSAATGAPSVQFFPPKFTNPAWTNSPDGTMYYSNKFRFGVRVRSLLAGVTLNVTLYVENTGNTSATYGSVQSWTVSGDTYLQGRGGQYTSGYGMQSSTTLKDNAKSFRYRIDVSVASGTVPASTAFVEIDQVLLNITDTVVGTSYGGAPSSVTYPDINYFDGDSNFAQWNGVQYFSSSVLDPALYTSYTGIDVGYDTAAIVNSVRVATLSGSTSTDNGPYNNQSSINTYGRQSASFTIASGPDPATWANNLTAVTGTPSIQAKGLTWAATDANSFKQAARADLFDYVGVLYEDKVNDSYRVTSLEHTITPKRWLVSFGFNKRADSTLW